MSFIVQGAFMTGRLTSTAGYYGALDEKIEKMFDRKKKREERETVSASGAT